MYIWFYFQLWKIPFLEEQYYSHPPCALAQEKPWEDCLSWDKDGALSYHFSENKSYSSNCII